MNCHTSISEETMCAARGGHSFPPEYRIVWTTVIHHHIAKENPMGPRDRTRGNSTPTLGYASGPSPRRVPFVELV